MLGIKRASSLLYILAATILFILSARAFAACFNPKLNSDHAIHILMAYHLKLPEDLYYWGQDRLGSLVPILSHILLKITALPSVVSVSYVQYFLLLIGFIAFASLIKDNLLKIAFAFAWFLPLRPFTELLAISQPYGPQMAFVGIAVALADRLTHAPEPIRGRRQQLLIAGITASLWVSIWLSEFSIFTSFLFAVLVIGIPGIRAFKRSHGSGWNRFGLAGSDALTIALVSLAGLGFIIYAKANAIKHQTNYSSFSSPAEIQVVISNLIRSFFRTITFRFNESLDAQSRMNFYLGIHAILVLCLIAFIVYLVIKERRNQTLVISRWTYLFLVNALLGMAVLISSYWVYKNGTNFRYFTVVYVSFWMAALLFAAGRKGLTGHSLKALLLLIAIVSSLSLHQRVFSFEPSKSKIQSLHKVETLGKAGFIGNYWTSYIICTVNPAMLNCTSRDMEGKSPCPPQSQLQDPRQYREQVRCPRCVPKVLASDTIYLVKERWLPAFPDQIEQFGQCLVRTGEPRKISGYRMAPYRKADVAPGG
jgi:hypothetical protein